MKLACNYLNEAVELLREGSVEFDYFKFPSLGFTPDKSVEFVGSIAKMRPILYHWFYPNMVYICDDYDIFTHNFDVEGLREYIKASKTPGLSIHLDGGKPDDCREKLISNAVKNLSFIKINYPEMAFFSIENIEKNENKTLYNPDFIREVALAADVSFLFDFSHGVWAAEDMGISFDEYIAQLPMDRCNEIHINGWNIKDGDMMAHMKIREESYDDIKRLIAIYPVEILTCEYGRSNDRQGIGIPYVSFDSVNERAKEELKEQLLRLAEIIRNEELGMRN